MNMLNHPYKDIVNYLEIDMARWADKRVAQGQTAPVPTVPIGEMRYDTTLEKASTFLTQMAESQVQVAPAAPPGARILRAREGLKTWLHYRTIFCGRLRMP